MTQDYTQLLVGQRGAACHITINRAAEHNTMTDVVMEELVRAFREAEGMDGVRAIVLTGAGEQTFCAGGKLKPTADGSPFALEPGRFGGGLGLICACDFAIATDSAKFGTTEAKVGVFPMMILPVLMRVIPRRRLQEMCFFAHRFSAIEAQQFDIVNEVVPAAELDAAVDAMVGKLAANSPVALRIGRRAISAVTDLSFSDALNLTQAVLPILSQSEDAKEGMKAFAERRTPVWPGR